jgi:hypothetical protein
MSRLLISFGIACFPVIWYRTRSVHIVRPPIDVLIGHISTAQPRCDSTGLSARVRELNADPLILAVRKFDDASQWINLRVFPEPGVFGRDPVFRGYGCRFDHGKAGPSQNDSAQMGKMPGSVVAVFGRVSAKRGELHTNISNAANTDGYAPRDTTMRICNITPLILRGQKSLGGCEPSG